jgi:putative oxidoreductase
MGIFEEEIMDFKTYFSVPTHQALADASLLLLRFVAGIAFMLHGWGKIQNPFGWMGPDAFAPGFLQALAALAEFGGGLAWIIGLLTPLASLGIACTMAVAAYMHAIMNGDPFVSVGGPSWELAALYFCIAVLLIAVGPGRFSLDRPIFGSRH